jgi:hypothetical protein
LLADPSTLKKKTKKRNRNNNNNNNNNNNILTNGSTKPFFGGDERLHSSSDGKITGKKTEQGRPPMLLRLVETERERGKHKTRQRWMEEANTSAAVRQRCVPFTAVNWITVRSEIQPIREDKRK